MGNNLQSHTEVIRLDQPSRIENASVGPTRRNALLSLAGLALTGARTSGDNRVSIEFTRIPQADDGGRAKNDIIEGRVNGAFGQCQIVLYARSGGMWWVQPLVSRPFTKIQKPGNWTAATHLGTDYAAVLVETGFHPPTTTAALPALGGPVVAVASVKGAKSSPSPSIQFSGYEWRLRDAPSSRGGHSRPYDPRNISTDPTGAVHLRVVEIPNGWSCAEMSLTRSLGYGTYSFTVRDTSHLDPAAVFTMFTWDYAKQDEYFSEMDIEISHWGEPNIDNGQYVVQPYYVPSSTSRFSTPAGTLKHSFRWEPARISFKTTRLVGRSERIVGEHSFASGVPAPAIESVRMNIYPIQRAGVRLSKTAEVVVERFEFLP
jgi:hypothetical protein